MNARYIQILYESGAIKHQDKNHGPGQGKPPRNDPITCCLQTGMVAVARLPAQVTSRPPSSLNFVSDIQVSRFYLVKTFKRTQRSPDGCISNKLFSLRKPSSTDMATRICITYEIRYVNGRLVPLIYPIILNTAEDFLKYE